MSENYMEVIEARLRKMFAEVNDGTMHVDDAVKFLKEELLTSYKNGRLAVGRGTQRKTTRPHGPRRRLAQKR